MVEGDAIPLAARRYYMLPLDKAGRDPIPRESKRPISHLRTFMKLRESSLARRMNPISGPVAADNQYALWRTRSAELSLADLDSFVDGRLNNGRMAYLVGRDIEGAFDNADLPTFMRPRNEHGEQGTITRFVGNLFAARTFRI